MSILELYERKFGLTALTPEDILDRVGQIEERMYCSTHRPGGQ